MRTLKMLGLAAIAALGLMAFVGAGTASATTLCTDSACTIKYPVGTTFVASLKTGTSAKLTSPKNTVAATCTGIDIHGSITTATASPGPVVVTLTPGNGGITWTGCNQTTDTTVSGKLDIEKGAGDTGVVKATETEVTVVLGGISCSYSVGEGLQLGTLAGGAGSVLTIEVSVKKSGGGFTCPAEPIWEAEVVVTEPHAVHFTN